MPIERPGTAPRFSNAWMANGGSYTPIVRSFTAKEYNAKAMINTSTYIDSLRTANPLREPLLRSAIQSLQLSPGSRGLDAGCGIGLQSLLLSQAVGTDGSVIGMDIDPEILVYGENLVQAAGHLARIAFCAGDINSIPFHNDSFDWVWSADCIGYPASDLQPLLQELVRVVRPGGEIILLAWSSQQLLPGYPLLEARLNATCSSYLPFLKDKRPDQNFLRALRSFQKVDLQGVRGRTFVSDVQAPFSDGVRDALIALFDMLWVQPQSDMSAQDWQDYQRLCQPGSPDFILDNPDYYAFFTYTMFRGKVPGGQ